MTTLLEYLEDKLTPSEWKLAEQLYSEETKVFLETLERFRQHFRDELKIMNHDIFNINGMGQDE